MNKLTSFAGPLLVLLSSTAGAQQSDSTFVADARKNAIQVYTQSIGVQSHLFDGSEYHEHTVSRDEYAYLHEDVMMGSVEYAGEFYENIPLYYDLEKDQLITSYPHGNKVQLLRDKVEYFTIDNHKYVLLDNNKVSAGFYDLLYDGKMKFYARRQKVLVLKVNSNGGEAHSTFEKRLKYFILKNDVYHTVKSKRSVIGLMSDRKKDLKRALRAENLRFRVEREKAIAFLLEHYEQINNPK